MLDERSLARVQRALAQAGLDGWLIYDFRGLNPVANAMLGIEGMATRRIFALIPATWQDAVPRPFAEWQAALARWDSE